jgi:D-tyrosyl-tRNA(Tyr) deacylase
VLFAFAPLSVSPSDTPSNVETVANKILRLRVWDAEDGSRWKKSVLDLEYQVLLVSQFTLLAATKRGYTPEFHGACPPAQANEIYSLLVEKVKEMYVGGKGLELEQGDVKVQEGVFGANMKVELVNDGPVTLEVLAQSKQPDVPGRVEQPGKKIKASSTRQRQVNTDRGSTPIGGDVAGDK